MKYVNIFLIFWKHDYNEIMDWDLYVPNTYARITNILDNAFCWSQPK